MSYREVCGSQRPGTIILLELLQTQASERPALGKGRVLVCFSMSFLLLDRRCVGINTLQV